MKYVYKLILFVGIAGMLYACEQEEKFDYKGGNQIYFSDETDSLAYSFAVQKSSVMQDVVNIPIAISGLPAAVDREIHVTIEDGTTAEEGRHFKLEKAVLKAGEIETVLPVEVYRQADLDGKEVVVLLKIVADNGFLGNMNAASMSFKLKINDILTQPENWDYYIYRYFGTYGPVKYQFIIDTLGISEFSETGENAVSKAEMGYYKDKLRNALIAYEKENGPLWEDEDRNIKVTF